MADSIGKDLQGPFNNIKVVLNDFVIPAFKALYNFMKDFVAPFFASVFGPALDGLFSAFNKVRNSINGNADDLAPLFSLFKSVATFVRDTMGPAIGTILRVAFEVLGTAISGVITGVSKVVDFLGDMITKVKQFIQLIKDNPVVAGIGGLIDKVFGGFKAMGGPVTSGTSYIVGEQGPELFTPGRNGSITPNHALGGGRGSVINLTVNGAIDPEGTARAIINVLNNSSYRGTLGSGAFA
jgi:hypothetical protein